MASSLRKINRTFYDTNFLQKYNQLSSIYSNYLPNDIREVFKWVNFIAANVPAVQSALSKMSCVAITSFNYTSQDLTELDEDDETSWKSVLENDLKIMEELKEIAYNFLLYANQFISVNFPIDRTFICTECSSHYRKNQLENREIIPIAKKNKNNQDELFFKCHCDKCKTKTLMTVKDRTVIDYTKVKIIKWPVNSIDLYEDDITGVKTFYYTPDTANKELIKKGNKDKIFYLPINIILAAITDGKVKFNEESIIHIRAKKFNGVNTAWGMPTLTSAIPDMISLMLLRKVNEKIYSDMMLPLRGLVPRMNNVDGNPIYNYISAPDLEGKVNKIINSWKKDPTGIKFFPIPLEPMNLFGEGKSLNLSGEIDAFTTMIIQSLGIPPEFIKGGLSWGGSGPSLRMLQNQLLELSTSLETVAEFVVKKIRAYSNKKAIRVKLIPLKLIDDSNDKANMLNLFQSGKVSSHTALDFFNISYRDEQKRLLEEQKDEFRRNQEMQQWQQEIATSLADKIRQESMMENSSTNNLNQTAILQEADSYAEQMASLDYGTKKSKLDELSKSNPVLYAVVKWRLEFMDQKRTTEAKHQQQ